MIRGITLDTGALMAIERRMQRGTQLLDLVRARLAILSVPVPVIAEWWRGRTDTREKILDVMNIEPLSIAVAKAAGEAQAKVRGATAIDAIVMALRRAAATSFSRETSLNSSAFAPSFRRFGCSVVTATNSPFDPEVRRD